MYWDNKFEAGLAEMAKKRDTINRLDLLSKNLLLVKGNKKLVREMIKNVQCIRELL